MDELLLREICRITGVTRRAVQGYEKAGLVTPCGKNKNGYLLYHKDTAEQIKKIKLFQERGFRLKEIKHFEQLSRQELKFVLINKILELKSKQAHLGTVADEIRVIITGL